MSSPAQGQGGSNSTSTHTAVSCISLAVTAQTNIHKTHRPAKVWVHAHSCQLSPGRDAQLSYGVYLLLGMVTAAPSQYKEESKLDSSGMPPPRISCAAADCNLLFQSMRARQYFRHFPFHLGGDNQVICSFLTNQSVPDQRFLVFPPMRARKLSTEFFPSANRSLPAQRGDFLSGRLGRASSARACFLTNGSAPAQQRGMLPRVMARSCSKMRAPSSRIPECAYSFVTHCRMPRICCAVSCEGTNHESLNANGLEAVLASTNSRAFASMPGAVLWQYSRDFTCPNASMCIYG